MLKPVVILIILIGLVFLGIRITSEGGDGDTLKVTLDELTKQAIAKGEYTVPEGVSFVESKDCEGTQWIKQQDCSLNGSPMDGTEGSCGPGKEIWILDPEHSDFKPATGDGKCEPEERDCSVECPKPCEGETWIEGACVRNEYVNGSTIETVLDGTSGKCGEGILKSTLDRSASDFKPAVGLGTCVTEKSGACNIPCPEPEPPRCNNYTGWVENVGLGCVYNQYTTNKVGCGESGVKQFFNVSTNPGVCAELVKWEDCTAAPCPINCVGSWSGWSACSSSAPCGVQPEKTNTYSHTTAAQYGGLACMYPDGYQLRENCGTTTTCCEETGDWAIVGTCSADGTGKYTQTYKENKVGGKECTAGTYCEENSANNGCPPSAKAKIMPCCYPKRNWTDTTTCNSAGIKTQRQDTVGNCSDSVKTRPVNCPYVGPWSKKGGCAPIGPGGAYLQQYERKVVNSDEITLREEPCCYIPNENVWNVDGGCGSFQPNKQRYIRPTLGTCTDSEKNKYEPCRPCTKRYVHSSYYISREREDPYAGPWARSPLVDKCRQKFIGVITDHGLGSGRTCDTSGYTTLVAMSNCGR